MAMVTYSDTADALEEAATNFFVFEDQRADLYRAAIDFTRDLLLATAFENDEEHAKAVHSAVGLLDDLAANALPLDTVKWTVVEFDENTLRGVVLRGDRREKFHSTSFASDSSMRWPRVGETVEVAFASSGAVLSVHGR